MLFPHSVPSARCALVSKCFAVVFVVLIVLPFTAPFSTFDLVELAGDASSQQGPLAGDSIDQGVSTIRTISSPIGLLSFSVPVPGDLVFLIESVRTAQRSVLRV